MKNPFGEKPSPGVELATRILACVNLFMTWLVFASLCALALQQ